MHKIRLLKTQILKSYRTFVIHQIYGAKAFLPPARIVLKWRSNAWFFIYMNAPLKAYDYG